jgi:hypothetical protein
MGKKELNIMSEFRFEEGKDYYLEKGKIIYTEEYLKCRGTCCGSGCRHCIYEPIHTKGVKTIREDLDKDLTDSE